MAWFDEFNLPGATIDGYFGFINADGPDDDDYPDVVLANGTVTFTATTEAARVDGAWLGIQPVTAQIFEGKIVVSEEDPRPVRLLATDAPIGVADWAWRASFKVDGFQLNELTFRAPRDTTVNLTADLIPIKSQPYQIIEGASIVDAEVSGEGTMRFELSDGSYTSWMDVPNGERGVPGHPGEKGDRGDDGAAATLAMGSVSAGSTADAWMTGTPLARELHLTLPRGQKGDKGDPGDPATPVSATATATEGAQWDVDVSFAGGALDFDFTVPPGGTAFWKGALDNTADLDTVTTPGSYGVWSSSPNAPASGVLQVSDIRTTGGVVSQVNQLFLVSGSAPQILSRFRDSIGWSGWKRLDAGAVDLSTLGGSGSGQSPATLKTVPLALTVGGSAATTDATGSVRFPVRFGARVSRWRVHITNINPRFGTLGGNRNITGVWFGPPTSNGQVSSLARVGRTQVNTSAYTTAWTTSPLEAGTDYLIGFGYSGSGPVESNVGGAWLSTSSTDAASTTGTWTRATSVPFDVWIEAETDATTPVVAAFGDSLSSGVGATTPVYDSWLSQWCRANGALPVHYTASGDTMQGWATSTAHKWQRWQHLSRPDAVVHAMGSNDVFGGADLATLQARRAVSMEQLRTMVSPVIYTATIMPRTSSTGALEDVRRSYNTWLKGSPDAARDLFDFVPAISADDENINPEFDADGIHLNTAGYTALVNTITRPLVSTAVKDALAGLGYDSGWRNVSSLLPAGVSGNVFLSREGKTVHLMVHNLSTTTAGHTVFLSLPVGFRPTAVQSGANWRNGTLATDNGDTVRPLSFFNNDMRVLNMVTGKQFGGYATWRVPPALPTTLPGTPA